MSHRHTTRRRSTFSLEPLETRKLAANLAPPVDAGIEHLDAETDIGPVPHLTEAQSKPDAEVETFGELIGSTGPHDTLDVVSVDVAMQETGAVTGDFL